MILCLQRLANVQWYRHADEPDSGGLVDGGATAIADDPAIGDGSQEPSPDGGDDMQSIAARELDSMSGPGRSDLPGPSEGADAAPSAVPSPGAPKQDVAAPTAGPVVPGGEVLQQFGLDVKDPQVAAQLAPRLAEVRQWAIQTQTAYQDVAQKYNELVNYVQQQQQGNPQQQAGSMPNPNEPPPEFETPTEERLWNQMQGVSQAYQSLRGQYDRMTEQLSQVQQLQQGHQQLIQNQQAERTVSEIERAEQDLAPKFPTLFKEGQMDQRVHQEALLAWDAALQAHRERGLPLPTVAAVLERACKLLDYDGVADRAVKEHAEKLRANARTYTLPGSTNGGNPTGQTTLAGIAAEEAARRGLYQNN